MQQARAPELVLGSVQLGLAYGAANRTGKPARPAALALVARAVDAGITQFDTARAYGDAEDRLGEALSGQAVRTITKLSPLPALAPDADLGVICAAVDASVAESRAALRRETLDCLLLHRASHMTSHDGAIWRRLLDHVRAGAIGSLGVSVQSPAEALAAIACPEVRHIQLPFNILDWRWRAGGVIDALAARPDIVIHARSAFLQGILASDDPGVWPIVPDADAGALITAIAQFAQDFGRRDAADLCLAYVRGQKWIDGVVVGLETADQLDANVSLFVRPPLTQGQCALLETCLPRAPAMLLDPAQWPKK